MQAEETFLAADPASPFVTGATCWDLKCTACVQTGRPYSAHWASSEIPMPQSWTSNLCPWTPRMSAVYVFDWLWQMMPLLHVESEPKAPSNPFDQPSPALCTQSLMAAARLLLAAHSIFHSPSCLQGRFWSLFQKVLPTCGVKWHANCTLPQFGTWSRLCQGKRMLEKYLVFRLAYDMSKSWPDYMLRYIPINSKTRSTHLSYHLLILILLHMNCYNLYN